MTRGRPKKGHEKSKLILDDIPEEFEEEQIEEDIVDDGPEEELDFENHKFTDEFIGYED